MTSGSSSLSLSETPPAQGGAGAATLATHTSWSVRWVCLLVLVYTMSAFITIRPIVDPDIWWHLRTGQWVLDHGSVPWTDPFSTYGANRPWVAYSWLFGVLVYGLYSGLGITGLVLYSLLGGLAATSCLLLLVLRFESRIPYAVALTAAGVAAMTPILAPRAYLFTVCFFIVEVAVLWTARETGRTRALWTLPPLFAIWANLHIQFVHGLLVLGFAVSEAMIVRLSRCRIDQRVLPARASIVCIAACFIATLITPYGIAIYRPVIEHGGQRLAYEWIRELAAPEFRHPANWVFLALVLGAAFMLGRRPLQVFPVVLLASGAYFSFSAGRDVWFLAIVSIAIIASACGDRRVRRPRLGWRSSVAAAMGVVIVVAGIAGGRRLSAAELEATVAREYPVTALAAVKQHRYPGPLYNTFTWGGFLIWRLPEHLVSIDGRANLHGDERIGRSLTVWNGHRGWDSDDELRAARLVIGPVGGALSQLLRRDGRYTLVYEDDIAAVFTR